MCCQILQGEGHYAMNARISLPDDKCYLLSEDLVNLTRVWHSSFSKHFLKVSQFEITLFVGFCFALNTRFIKQRPIEWILQPSLHVCSGFCLALSQQQVKFHGKILSYYISSILKISFGRLAIIMRMIFPLQIIPGANALRTNLSKT